MIDKDIELLKKEHLEELKLLNKQVEELNKEKKKLKKLNDAQSRIINKRLNHAFLRKYIREDKTIFKIVEMLMYCGFKAHRKTFKDFLTNEYKLEIDNMKGHELEAVESNLHRFQHVSLGTIDKKLEELKALKLIEFNDDNYYIKGTDLLITIIYKEYKRIKKGIKSAPELIIETEDKLFAYRFTLENGYFIENKELIDKFKIYNSIYTIDQNIFVLGRRGHEDEGALRRRLLNMIKSDLVNTDNLGESDEVGYEELLKQNNDNIFNLPTDKRLNTYLLVTIYISKKIKINIEDIVGFLEFKISNPIQIIRY